MSSNAVVLKTTGAIAWLTLNRPDRMNALSKQMVADLNAILDELTDDRDVRILALIGSGERAFCAGADLKERSEMSEDEVRAFVTELRHTMKRIHDFPKIVVAGINGVALGGGLEMAAACDLRYAAAGSKLGLTETSLGIIPGAGGTQYLPRVIGVSRAKELIFSARPIQAERAAQWGLLNDVFQPSDFVDRLTQRLEVLAGNAPIALAQAKQAIDQGIQKTLVEGLAVERECYARVIPTRDRLEGLRAFREKRKPNFFGR